ncbi:hypothetical protein J4E89_008971 [Alternaria sp. Ai002NY15]|nr:hypothetical protein J4E89_008971 [Alternaria sp. Ai002NY15]
MRSAALAREHHARLQLTTDPHERSHPKPSPGPEPPHSNSKQSTTAKMPQAQPELKKYLEKRVLVQLNGSRKVMGILRGYDVYLNIVLDEALEEKAGGEKVRIGMVVIRGNAVVMLEALDRINQDVPKIGR